MKRELIVLTTIVLAGVAGWAVTTAVAGDLNPPAGPVTPSMKTLTEVQPRTPISDLPHHITQPGSYYLTGNLSNESGSLYIESSDVTVDLNGFNIFSTDNRSAIRADNEALSQIVVRNGSVTGDGTGRGIFLRGANMRVEDVSLRNCKYSGIAIQGGNNLVTRCTVTECSGAGIISNSPGRMIVKACVVNDNQQGGIDVRNSLVIGCVAVGNTPFDIEDYTNTLVDNHTP